MNSMDIISRVGVLVLWLGVAGVAQDVPGSRTKGLPEPQLGVLYHYDYRHPDLGFSDEEGRDVLTVHPAETKGIDLARPEWHRTQIDGMIAADVDFIAPLYSGPQHRGRGDEGLAALVKAWMIVEEAGGEPPLIAPFLDTRPLLAPEAGAGISDLRRPEEITRFAAALTSYFARVPDELRFRLGEFFVVFVGPSYGVPHGRDLFETVADRLFAKLGRKVFIIAESSWQARRPSRFRGDAALMGPRGDTIVRFVGPGYDDTRTRGRGTPRRDREETRFYRWSFDRVLLDVPTLVVVDSWNDFRQGTAIAPSREFGSRYVDLTRQYVRRLKSRVVPDAANPVRLAYPDPLPRPDTGWFSAGSEVKEVSFRPGSSASILGEGLRVARVDDGSFRFQREGDAPRLVSPGPGERYLYFGIADEFASRVKGAFRIRLRFVGGGAGRIGLQYDSWNRSATLEGRYRAAPEHRRSGILRERRLSWTIPDARFANRQNGGADLRLVLRGDDFELIELKVERVAGPGPKEPALEVD